MPNAPFYGVSTSKSDYVPYGAPRVGADRMGWQSRLKHRAGVSEGCSAHVNARALTHYTQQGT